MGLTQIGIIGCMLFFPVLFFPISEMFHIPFAELLELMPQELRTSLGRIPNVESILRFFGCEDRAA